MSRKAHPLETGVRIKGRELTEEVTIMRLWGHRSVDMYSMLRNS